MKCSIRPALISFTIALGTMSGPAIADVNENARVAQQRLGQLLMGELLYMNETGQWATPPELLFSQYVPDPMTFWHPGDSDAPPVTINNSVPNAPDSAAISFNWMFPTGRNYFGDTPMVQDNTPANNEGQFINFVTIDGVVETDPPNAAATPTQFALARAHLRRLFDAIVIYTNDNQDWTPDSLYQLWNNDVPGGSKMFTSTRTFWNPGDPDPLPSDYTNSIPNDPHGTEISFHYLIPHLRGWLLQDGLPMLRDNSPDNNRGYGVFEIVCCNPVAIFIPVCPGDINQDHVVDLSDLALLLANFGLNDGYQTPAEGDINADGHVDMTDLSTLLANFGARC